jgi:hypothetical protein
MNLLALPIQDKKIKFSFPIAGLVGLVLALSAFIPVLVHGLRAFFPVLAWLSVSSVFFLFWAGTIGIPCLAICILIELCKRQFAQAAYTSAILILDMIPVYAYFLTPIGQFLSKQ